MTIRQHLRVMRIIRAVSTVAGLAILIPYLISQGADIRLSETGPLLLGLVILLIPHGFFLGILAAECTACGGRAYAEVKRTVQKSTGSNEDVGRIRAYVWKCDDCKHIEKVEATWLDKLMTPTFHSSGGIDTSNDAGE